MSMDIWRLGMAEWEQDWETGHGRLRPGDYDWGHHALETRQSLFSISCFYAPPWRSILFSSCPFATEVVVSVRDGSQLTGVPWDLRLTGHTSSTHTFLVSIMVFSISSPFLVSTLSYPCFGAGNNIHALSYRISQKIERLRPAISYFPGGRVYS